MYKVCFTNLTPLVMEEMVVFDDPLSQEADSTESIRSQKPIWSRDMTETCKLIGSWDQTNYCKLTWFVASYPVIFYWQL